MAAQLRTATLVNGRWRQAALSAKAAKAQLKREQVVPELREQRPIAFNLSKSIVKAKKAYVVFAYRGYCSPSQRQRLRCAIVLRCSCSSLHLFRPSLQLLMGFYVVVLDDP